MFYLLQLTIGIDIFHIHVKVINNLGFTFTLYFHLLNIFWMNLNFFWLTLFHVLSTHF